MATAQQITASLQSAMDGFVGAANRGASWMRIRRALGEILRGEVGNDYFVKVRASRADREAGRIQVRALFAGNDVSLTLQLA